MLGKFTMTGGITLVYAYTAELYPTVLRNTATGTCSAFSKVGSSIAPFLSQLIDTDTSLLEAQAILIDPLEVKKAPEPGPSGPDCAYFKYLPYIVMGTLAVVSAFAVLFLPESLGRPLPQTIQQMHKRERWVP
ncbi:Solute carrier family 22 member 5 [Liparis tanakae]|uniref:Solute carrier family 22 member 5 n=1 Tax=Liparis tanakae TaxID=230148 RepID=A0A4Z2E483_9TELE|nr:Solute carrier family 22 member 5 [Liparis tanakae]